MTGLHSSRIPPRFAGVSHRSFLVWLSLTAFAAGHAAAQTPESTTTSAERTMPGFAVLDSSIMSIEHVAPLQSTALKLFSTLRNNDLVPRDIGFEILPWLVKRPAPGTTVERVYEQQYRPGVLGSIGQYAAWSLAVSQHGETSANEDAFSFLSLGFRTFLWSGHANGALVKAMADYDSLRKQLDEALDAQTKTGAGDAEQQRTAAVLTLARAARQELARADKNRVGFMLETGTVFALRVPANVLRDATVDRRAWWATPIYRFERRPMTISAIMRYIDEREAGSHTVDLGGRITAGSGGTQYFMESIGRIRRIVHPTPADDLHTGRTVGGISYGFSRTTSLSFTMGKSYRNDFSQSGSLVASFGLNIAVGEMPLGIPQQ